MQVFEIALGVALGLSIYTFGRRYVVPAVIAVSVVALLLAIVAVALITFSELIDTSIFRASHSSPIVGMVVNLIGLSITTYFVVSIVRGVAKLIERRTGLQGYGSHLLALAFWVLIPVTAVAVTEVLFGERSKLWVIVPFVLWGALILSYRNIRENYLNSSHQHRAGQVDDNRYP